MKRVLFSLVALAGLGFAAVPAMAADCVTAPVVCQAPVVQSFVPAAPTCAPAVTTCVPTVRYSRTESPYRSYHGYTGWRGARFYRHCR